MKRWLIIALLSMTPNLILGQQMAAYFGIRWELELWFLLPVMMTFGYLAGTFWSWVGGVTANAKVGWWQRFLTWLRKPRAVAFAQKWGVWGGMTLGVAMFGQEPIILSLRWLGVPARKLWIPMIVANVVSCTLFYWLTKIGVLAIENYF